jgi:hypothetical protein
MDNWILDTIRRRSRRRMAAWLLAFAAAAAGIVYVYFITGSSQGRPGRSTAALVLAILAALMLMVAAYERPTVRAMFDPRSHPTFRRLRSWGDVEATVAAIERESRAPRLKALRGWSVTDSFLIQSHPFTFDVFRYEDVRDARAGRTWYWRYYTLPIPFLQAFHEVVVRCTGRTLHMEASRRRTEEILQFMKQRPWMLDRLESEASDVR